MGPPSDNGGYENGPIVWTTEGLASMGPPSDNGGYGSRVQYGITLIVSVSIARGLPWRGKRSFGGVVGIRLTPFFQWAWNTRGVMRAHISDNSELSKSIQPARRQGKVLPCPLSCLGGRPWYKQAKTEMAGMAEAERSTDRLGEDDSAASHRPAATIVAGLAAEA